MAGAAAIRKGDRAVLVVLTLLPALFVLVFFLGELFAETFHIEAPAADTDLLESGRVRLTSNGRVIRARIS